VETKNDMNRPFLSVKDLVVDYTSEGQIIHAVNNVSFDLCQGKTLGLVGETGAGKTTIAKTIMRILPDRSAHIRTGKILLDGEDVLSVSEIEMRKIRGNKVSMVFQDPMTALNPVMRIGEQISEVIRNHKGVSKSKSDDEAIKMLEMVGIPSDRFREYPHQFSGGMKQRVVIAIALVCNPDLLLADEPTTALDVTIQAQVLDMMSSLKNEFNTSMILITHDLGIVANVCDDMAVIYAGDIVEYGNKEEIFDHPSHPYTIGLFGALPDMNTDEEWLHPIEGLPPDPSNLPPGCAFAPRCKYATHGCNKEKPEMYEITGNHSAKCRNAAKVSAVFGRE
jgi:peptide/nickel transport system ATP-binding protein